MSPRSYSTAFLIAMLMLFSCKNLKAEEIEQGLIGEFFSLGEPVVDFPALSPGTPPTYRRLDRTIDFGHSQTSFPGTDLQDQFYARWRGKIRIPKSGLYTFFLESDDGARLFIDGQLVVDNGGLHHWLERSGQTQLAVGEHNIEVDYFQNAVFSGCRLLWQPEGLAKEVVPSEVLGHAVTSDVVQKEAWFIPSDNTYHPRLWESVDGLPHNSVSTVVQTQDGYLWAGTPKGLTRFDGMRFTTVDLPEASQLNTSQGIRCLYATRDGTLLIGPERGGLFSFQKGILTPETFPEGAQIRAMLQSRDGTVWIGTTRGLQRRKDGVTQWFGTDEGLPFGVLSLCEDDKGNLWVGSNSGLFHFKEGKFVHMFGEAQGQVRAVCVDAQKDLWFANGASGLFRLKDGKFKIFGKADGLLDELVSAILMDNRKELWVGTYGGLCRFSGERFVTELNGEGTAYDTVYCLTEDKEGSVWLGTKEGLSQLRRKPFKAYTQRQGLSHNNIMSVSEDTDGTVWMATWGGGLSGLKNGQVSIYRRENTPLYDLLLSLRHTRDGSLWIGSEHQEGLFQFKDGFFTRHGPAEGLDVSAIRVIYEDRKGSLWIGSSSALHRRSAGTFQRFTTANGLSDNKIRAILEDRHGRLWIGTARGLTLFENERFTRPKLNKALANEAILSIYEDHYGNIWVGTDGNGLHRLRWPTQSSNAKAQNSANLLTTEYTTRNGLMSDSIYEIIGDERGHLWMTSFSGISKIRIKTFDELDAGKIDRLPCIGFGKAEGMTSVQCNGVAKPGAWEGKDRRLWFPTTRGVVVVDPKTVRETDSAPPVRIEELVADKENIAWSESTNTHPGAGASSPALVRIPAGRGELEIHYTALSFRSPEKNAFRYKLTGVDPDWVDAGTRRVAYYNNLPPGDYAFQVIACNSDGVWNQSGASLKLHLQPQFWQTTWFLAFSIVAGVGVVGSGARYVAWRNMQRRLDRLEKQHAIEKERSRIARDMHDDLGVRLTELLLVGERAAQPQTGLEETKSLVRKTSHSIREVVDGMDAIVWAVNPQNDSLARFVPYVREYIQSFLEPTDIRFSLQIPADLPNLPLSSEVRHNLYMVIREALNNVVKHSQATNVRFSLTLGDGKLTIEIADDGKGFTDNNSSLFGNGLLNMRKRISSIHGQLEIASDPGKGTRVRAEIPIAIK